MLTFLPIDSDGRTPQADAYEASPAHRELIDQIGAMMADQYQRGSATPPWLGYIVARDRTIVGTCGYKLPPVDGRVEIAYFTFPEFERQGVATAMAQRLIEIAWQADPALVVVAQTLPEENASARLLKRIGFQFAGSVQHPEDGEVWEWRLPPLGDRAPQHRDAALDRPAL